MHVFYEGQVLWSQLDANQHLRHSAYADFGAQARLAMLEQAGLKPSVLFKYKIGPILFKEELFYLREIGINEYIKVTAEITRMRSDGSRWAIRHEIYRHDGIKAAIINVDGAFIDQEKRKLTILPDELNKLFAKSPRSDDYQEELPKTK